MSLLAIILIIINIVKLYIVTIINNDTVYPPVSLNISQNLYILIIKCVLSFDGLIGIICGLYIL